MTSMLFYQNIVPLNRDRHRQLRLMNAGGSARFAQHTHYVPLACAEFYQAARDYPVIFAGKGEDTVPIALLGLRENENLFIDADGSWANGHYVPAFVRRYPFVLATGDDQEAPPTVCVDEHYAGFSEQEGSPLFGDDGAESDYLSRTVAFLNQFSAEIKHTGTFTQRLEALDLLVQRDLKITDHRGREFRLHDFRVVDERRLADLDDTAIVELHRSGFLGLIHAHLISLGNTARLPSRLTPEGEAQADNAPRDNTAAEPDPVDNNPLPDPS